MTKAKPKGKRFDPSLNRTKIGRPSVPVADILRRAMAAEALPAPSKQAVFGDFTCTQLDDAMAAALRAEERFMQFPAKTRERFSNSPLELLRWAEAPERTDEELASVFGFEIVEDDQVDQSVDQVESPRPGSESSEDS